MPIDSSIALQAKLPEFENPLNQLARVAQLQQAQNQNKLFDMQYAEKQRETAGDNALAALLSKGLKPDEVATGLASQGYGAKSMAYSKQAAEMAKQQRETEKATLEQAMQKQGVIAQYAGAAKDQASWTQGLQALQQMGIDVSQVPQQFDPNMAATLRNRALTGVQQLEQVWKQKQFDMDTEKFAETKRHNRSTEGIAGANLKVSQGNLDVARNRLEFEKQGGKDKPTTEAERTAAGYGLRMQEAEQIIGGVSAKDPKAQKPGMIESVAGPGMVSNFTSSSNRQQYRQAQEDWVRAKLRKESGAVIGEEEMAREIQTYFPQPGEKPEVIAQKAKARQTAMEAMKTSAGKAGKNLNNNAPNIDDLLKKYGG